MRQNGLGTLTLDDARTWIEETGLCLFLPRRQFSSSVAPSFVEAVAGRQEATPDPKIIAIAEDLLVRLENEGVAVRLNLSGQPGEQPDYVVAAWVLPYVYALRGDRDWRRSPQLTGSRQVSQLAVHVYKRLEGGDLSVSQLRQALGREVSEAGVIRAITELWQQLRIIPVIATRGQAAKWQLLRTRFQRAIAEGASTSQVTAISVLASIFLQAVIAASMEDVELFLAPLTARSKIREVIRGLVATRQVHTISLGHAPHFYVAGTLPEFEPVSTVYANSTLSASSYFSRAFDRDEDGPSPAISVPLPHQAQYVQRKPASTAAPQAAEAGTAAESDAVRSAERENSSRAAEPARPHFSRPAPRSHERKAAGPNRSSQNGRARRAPESRQPAGRKQTAKRTTGNRWAANGSSKRGTAHASNGSRSGSSASHSSGSASHRNGKSTSATWSKRPANGKAKPGSARKEARPARNGRPALATAGRTSASGKRFFNNRSKSRTGQGTKKRG